MKGRRDITRCRINNPYNVAIFGMVNHNV